MNTTGFPQRKFLFNIPPKKKRLLFAGGLLLCLLAGGVASLWRGPDYGFDNSNYHIYNAWAFLNGRLNVDLYPAEFRSYFYPLLDLPYYFLACEWLPDSPRAVAFIMGLPAGVLFFLTFLFIREVLGAFAADGISSAARYLYSAILTLFGVSGISIVSQIGYTSNEIPVACLILGGLFAFVRLQSNPAAAGALAGALFGIAAGLKLTTHVFVPPLLVAMFLFYPTWRERVRAGVCFCVAWWVAFLAIFGYWGWTLYKLTGNPVFPGMNNLFKSDWIPHDAGMDNRFIPHGARHILFFPFYWVQKAIVTDGVSTDVRFLLTGIVAATAAVFFLLRCCVSAMRKTASKFFAPASLAKHIPDSLVLEERAKSASGEPVRFTLFVLAFVLLSYVIWEYQFSTLRYAIPVETLLGLLLFLLVLAFFRIHPHPEKHTLLTAILLAFTVTALALDEHERPRAAFQSVIHPKIPALPQNTLVLVFPGSLFLAPEIAKENPDVVFFGGMFELPVSGPSKSWRELGILAECEVKEKVRKKIKDHRGNFRILAHEAFDFSDAKIMEKCAQYNLRPAIGSAQKIQTNYGTYKLYPIQRKGDK